jgi:hypothetical protein
MSVSVSTTMSQYWFKPKRYGYGATPATWEGWLATFVAAAVVAGSVIAMNLLVDRSNAIAWLIWAAFVALATFWFVKFTRRRTAGEWRWRWGRTTEP